MSIAEKIIRAKQDYDDVYDAGKQAGKQAEYDAFWDVLQNKGKGANYYYLFSYGRFTDENYKPKYDLVGSTVTNALQNAFYNSPITDTKVDIYANSTHIGGLFYQSTELVTIRKLVMTDKITSAASAFTGCKSLKNITIEGSIACDFDIHWSPLTKESVISIIEHLSDTATGKTLSLNSGAVGAGFDESEWNELVASKTNWTISLV